MNAITPLLDSDCYDQFTALRPKMEDAGVSNIAHVFVSVGASLSQARANAPRILFVGRATRGFDEDYLASFEGAFESGKRVFLDGFSGRWSHTGRHLTSAFWAFNRAIAGAVLQSLEIPFSDDELPCYCGWSNLAKIGDSKGNPTRESLSIQAELCIAALQAEITAFSPTAVVVSTGTYAMDEIILPVFGKEDWSWMTPQNDLLSWKYCTETGALIAWTNHPQRMGRPGSLACVRKFITALIVKAWRRELLPPSAERRASR